MARVHECKLFFWVVVVHGQAASKLTAPPPPTLTCEPGYYLDDKTCVEYAGMCEHGQELELGQRTDHHQCGTCNPGYYLDKRRCRGYLGMCEHGEDLEQGQRTGHHQCGKCDHGYYLDNKRCLEYAGMCEYGQDLPQKERTGHQQCGSCDRGYYLKDKKCLGFDGMCEHGQDLQQGQRTDHHQCGRCHSGYYLINKTCHGYAGNCEHGQALEQGQRTGHHQCGRCDHGYYLKNKRCFGYAGNCEHGQALEQAQRTDHHQCGHCNNGFYLDDKTCLGYVGDCEHGQDLEQSHRTDHHQCGSCDPGFQLMKSRCERCPSGKYSENNMQCTGCHQLDWILRQEVWNPASMRKPLIQNESCQESAFIKLAQKQQFANRTPFARVLLEPPENANIRPVVQLAIQVSFSEDTAGNTWAPQATPVVMFIQHCNRTPNNDDVNFLNFLIENGADLQTGNPADRARDRGCDVMREILKAHKDCGCRQSWWTTYIKNWKESINHSTRVFIGPRHVFDVDLLSSLVMGLILGVVVGVLHDFVWRGCSTRAADAPSGRGYASLAGARRGWLEVAALVKCHPVHEWNQVFMCIGSVFASIIFPAFVCMSTVTPSIFLAINGLYALIPNLLFRKHFDSIPKLLLVCPGSPPLLPGLLAITRPLVAILISMLAAVPEQSKYMETAASYVHPYLRPWFLMRKWVSETCPPPAGMKWATNIRAAFTLDPFHLMESEAVALFYWTFRIQPRLGFYSFEAITFYVAVLWTFLAVVCLVHKKCADPSIQQMEATEIHTLAIKLQDEHAKEVPDFSRFQEAWDIGPVARCVFSVVPLFGVETTADGRLKRNVQPFSQRTFTMQTCRWLSTHFADVVLLHGLYHDGCHAFAGFKLMVCTWFMTLKIIRKHIKKLKEQVDNVRDSGVPDDAYWEVIWLEQGVEATLNLIFTAYTIRFTAMTAQTLIFGFIGLLLNMCSVVQYLFIRGVLKSKYETEQPQEEESGVP